MPRFRDGVLSSGLRRAAAILAAVAGTAAAPALQAAPALDVPLGTDTVAAFRWSAALDAFGQPRQAEPLRRSLWDRYLRAQAGENLDANLTLGQAIAAGASLPPVAGDGEARQRWVEIVNRHLTRVPTEASVPLPPELEADAARLREVGPGLWARLAADGSTSGWVWWLILRHGGSVPLTLAEFAAVVPGAGLRLDCSPPRYAELALLQPGRDTPFVCREPYWSARDSRAATAVIKALTGPQPLPLKLEPTAQDRANAILRLERAAQPQADSIVAGWRAQAGGAADTAAVTASKLAQRKAANKGAPTWDLPRWQWLSGAAGLLVFFCIVARVLGRGFAVGITGLFLIVGGLTVLARGVTLPGGSSVGPGSGGGIVLVVGGALVLFASFVVTALLALIYELLFGDRERLLHGLWRSIVRDMTRAVIDRIVGRRR